MFDPLDELEAALDKVAAAEGAVDVERISRLSERLDCERLRAVGRLDRARAYEDDGALTAAAWLRRHCRTAHGTAQAAVSLARKLERLPETANAFAGGRISRSHVRVIADACTEARRAVFLESERDVVAVALETDPLTFRRHIAYFADALDGDGGSATATAQHDRRRLHVSQLLDGMVAIDGLMDREAGEVVVSALQAATDPPTACDSRTGAQRRVDAFVRVCEAAAPELQRGPGRSNRPHVTVTVDLEVLERRAGAQLVTDVRADTAYLGRLSPETLRRVSCDATIARIVTQGRSEILDVGRTTRVVSAVLWKALEVRDGGCVADGCDRPPGWCDAHHKVHWIDGGPTDLDNLELRCRRHHRAVHEDARRFDPG